MTSRIKRSKASRTASVCETCGRAKGDRKRKPCGRCPNQPIAASLALEQLMGVRLLVVDESMACSGVAVTSPHYANRLEHVEEVDTLGARVDDVVRTVLAMSAADGAPTWMVLEDPGIGGPRATPDMFISIGQAIGIWRRAWVIAGGADSRVILIRQNTWIAGAVPGTGQLEREQRELKTIDTARVVWGGVLAGVVRDASGVRFEQATSRIDWTADTAAASMLAWFTLRWPEFTDRISKRELVRAAVIAEEGGAAEAGAAPSPPLEPGDEPFDAPEPAPKPTAPKTTAPTTTQGWLFG